MIPDQALTITSENAGGYSWRRDSAGFPVCLPRPPGRERREPGLAGIEREAAGHRGGRRCPRRGALPPVCTGRRAAREEPYEIQQVEQGHVQGATLIRAVTWIDRRSGNGQVQTVKNNAVE